MLPSSPVELVPLNLVSCASALWRMDGVLRVTIVVKATFGLVPDATARLIAPAKLVTRDRYCDGNPAGSLAAASEVAPYLPSVGVLVVGHAYGPGGSTVPAVTARLALLRARVLLDKTVHVFGDRSAEKPGSPRPFQRMPLRYERAFGGPGVDRNPIGTGAASGSAPPNLVSPTDPRSPAGFGPIPVSWPARGGLLDPAARALVTEKIPNLATGFPFGYFQPAPPDQRLEGLEGDEWIHLEGLHPLLPRVRSRLPSARGVARAVRGTGPLQPIELSADLLVIDTDQQVCSVVWRGQLVASEGEAALDGLRVFVGVELPEHPIPWPRPSAPPEAVGAAPTCEATAELLDLGATSVLSSEQLEALGRQAVTPFANAEGPTADPSRAVSLEGTPWAPSAAPASVAAFAPSVWASGAVEPVGVATPAVLDASTLEAVAPFVDVQPSAPPAPHTAPPSEAFPEPLPLTSDPREPDTDAAFPRSAAGSGAASKSPARRPPSRGDKPAIPVVTSTPLVTVTVPWQVRPPKDSITVIVKGTFDLVPDGAAVLRAEGDFPIGDVYLDDEPSKSLVHGSDLAIFKPRADVTLTGTAYAPKAAGGATPAMQVTFEFGTGSRGFVRRAAVLGDRHWHKAVLALAPTEPEPFATMPLTWERAFGGPAFEANPLGAGHKGHSSPDGVSRLPNLEDPAHLISSPSDGAEPACCAPIAMLWKQRWTKLGTYDRRWFTQRWPYFPEDFDWAFFQVAPKPQQLPYLTGDETFRVVGMRPDMPRLDGRLPGLRARCFLQMTDEAGAEFREVTLVLDTAAFDVDAMKLSLVWRAVVEVSDEEAPEIEAIFVTSEELGAAPMTLVEARAQYVRAATPAPIEVTEPKVAAAASAPSPDDPSAETEIAEARAQVRKQLEAAGIPQPDDDAPIPEPPAPDPGAVAASLRAAGASDEDIAEVLAVLTPPLDGPADEDTGAQSVADVRVKVIEMLARDEPFDGLDLAGADLAELDFSNRSLVGTLLKGANLRRCSFASAKLEGAVLARADLTEAQLTGADLSLADLAGVKAPRAAFTGATVDDADFSGSDLEGAVFDEVHGESTQFERCCLARASLRGADLRDAELTGANLDGAVLDGAALPQARLYDVTAHGASFRDVVMPGARVERAKATKAIFANMAAPGSVWERALLNEASFLGAALPGTSFARATCLRTVFSMADLTEARFRRARLGGASFLHANLMMATFERADLTLADLRGANLHAAETWKAKLDHAQLDQAIVTGSKLE